MAFKSGFVNIIGKPNAGKSTLLNALSGQKLSIVTPKAQTTRQRITAVLTGKDYQIIFSDTPGWIDTPRYEMHRAMLRAIESALEDADILMLLADVRESPEQAGELPDKLRNVRKPVFLVLNKTDLVTHETVNQSIENWKQLNLFAEILPVSALLQSNLDQLKSALIAYLPTHPPYYPEDTLTDKTLRFLASEIIREKIFLHYREEIPYSCEVYITDYRETPQMDYIRAEILVERDSQKAILIGKGGSALKQVGMASRKDIEEMVGKQVMLELHVKVAKNWRNNRSYLKRLGYS
ncbi:MAG: GTPase Era [Chitinophagales bacterium]|nr:MAG: GTPase Era [Chitinophagales bacterium]